MGVAYVVGRLERALRRRFRQALKPQGLTLRQYTALSVFHSNGQNSSAMLAEHTVVSPQAANELIKNMEMSGWLVRKPDPKHPRIINIRLTQKGRKVLVRCDNLIAKLEREMLAGLSDKQIITLHGQLHKAVAQLRNI